MKASETFPNLPDDIKAELDRYDDDIKAGKIRFAHGSEFATRYPREVSTDRTLAAFVDSHIPTEV